MARSSHPGFGIEIAFAGLAEDAKTELERWCAEHAKA